ncbi:MAG: methyltransferase domain-containing protein [Syntrophaceae bacterium]|nr:methyltransferase domain-containing protein [Syntrophaceae bacterium]
MMKIRQYFNAGLHYDSITAGWRYILGDNFHFGYFKSPDDDLDTATNNLIDKLASLGKLGPETKILDAGCGIGNPAFYLHKKFGSDITGVSTSKKGVDLANSLIGEDKYKGKIRFRLLDMTATGFPDAGFDVIWVMESSHLIRNKKLLFDECYRLLKPGGLVLLADVMIDKKHNFIFKLKNFFKLLNTIKTFAKAHPATPERYSELLSASGFKKIILKDIGEKTEQTLNWWQRNIMANRSNLLKIMDAREIRRFEKAIGTFQYLFKKGIIYYCLFSAEK